MVDFLYFGEANVYQENIESFLAIAEELNLKGLTGNVDDNKSEDTKTQNNKLKREYNMDEDLKASGFNKQMEKDIEKELRPIQEDEGKTS